MREAVSREQGPLVAVLASGRGWAVLLQATIDAEATAQMSKALNMAAFLADVMV
ncbi:MAG: hypothetical protein PVSMB1_16020 [Gemmatimonadaceae bacterium]